VCHLVFPLERFRYAVVCRCVPALAKIQSIDVEINMLLSHVTAKNNRNVVICHWRFHIYMKNNSFTAKKSYK